MNEANNTAEQAFSTPITFPFELVDVRLWEVTIKRCDPDEKVSPADALRILLYGGDEPPNEREFSVMLTFAAYLRHKEQMECKIDVALEGQFRSIVDADSIKPSVIQRFKTSDAVLLLWPYLRETVHNFTTRMRLGAPPLPIVDARALVSAAEAKEASETE